jgi:hypothetical protein
MKFEQETNKWLPYQKVRVRIGTLEVTPTDPVAAIISVRTMPTCQLYTDDDTCT